MQKKNNEELRCFELWFSLRLSERSGNSSQENKWCKKKMCFFSCYISYDRGHLIFQDKWQHCFESKEKEEKSKNAQCILSALVLQLGKWTTVHMQQPKCERLNKKSNFKGSALSIENFYLGFFLICKKITCLFFHAKDISMNKCNILIWQKVQNVKIVIPSIC